MIGIIVGSDSDLDTMNNCVDKLNELKIGHEIVTASAHRNPDKVTEWNDTYRKNLKIRLKNDPEFAVLKKKKEKNNRLEFNFGITYDDFKMGSNRV